MASRRCLAQHTDATLAGKSALLRALAGRHPTGGVEGKGTNVAEAVTFNGRTPTQLDAAGVRLERLAAYAPQEDVQEPLLTVRETLTLAHLLASARIPDAAPAHVREEHAARVDAVIDVLGLRECEHTIVGSVAIRGISGGQKKRVTVGEALLSNARVLVLDEATNGLDASTAFEIVSFLREWARGVQGTVVMALQVRAAALPPLPPPLAALVGRGSEGLAGRI